MENIPTYLKRRSHQEKVVYPLKELEPILKSTYGIMVYQEQMMQVAQKMAGFSLAKADILRKATSKKETELMHSMKEEFIAGCLKNGFSQEKAEEAVSYTHLGKEWYEQAQFFEQFCKGKTADEIAGIETEKRDEEHTTAVSYTHLV